MFADRIEAKWIDASCEVFAKCTASLPTAAQQLRVTSCKKIGEPVRAKGDNAPRLRLE
jgi:hypothetical protein